MFYAIEKDELLTKGLPYGFTNGLASETHNDVANVGTTAGDNLRVKGIPAEPLRKLIAPEFCIFTG